SSLGTVPVSGGVATRTVTGALAGSITISVTAASLRSDATTFTIVPGAAAQLTFTSSAANLSAGVTRTLTAEVRDAGGNVVASDNTTLVTFAKTGGTGTVAGLGSATASGGTASETVTAALAGPITITASASLLATATTTF